MITRMQKNLEMYFPYIARDASDYHDGLDDELIIELTDGSFVLYDDQDKSIRNLPSSPYELTEANFKREFGLRLRKIMNRKFMSQTELSEKTGISRIVLNKYINGKNMPSFYNLDKIAKALKCSIDDLRYSYDERE